MEWDCLTEEARLRGDVGAQLGAAQQREAEARQDAEEIHGMFQDLSVRMQQDKEATARVRKEQDELLQKDATASQWAVEVLAKLEMEQDLRRKAKDRSTALQQRVDRDTEVIAWLCEERDEICRTKARLRSEHSTTREDHDRAIRERDEVRWEVRALRADLGDAVARRLEAEEISAGLGTKLTEVRGLLQVESDQHDLLCSAILAVCDDLQVA